MKDVFPGSFVSPSHDDICLWAEPLQIGCRDRVPIAQLDPRELLLVVAIETIVTGQFALVVSSSSRALGYVNVKWLHEVAL